MGAAGCPSARAASPPPAPQGEPGPEALALESRGTEGYVGFRICEAAGGRVRLEGRAL